MSTAALTNKQTEGKALTQDAERDEKVVFTEAQRTAILNKVRYLRSKGKPGLAFQLRDRMKAGLPIEPHEYMVDVVRPEKSTAGRSLSELALPPRSGVGSTTDNWRAFASAVSLIDEEVIDSMSRADIMAVLEEREIIDRAEAD